MSPNVNLHSITINPSLISSSLPLRYLVLAQNLNMHVETPVFCILLVKNIFELPVKMSLLHLCHLFEYIKIRDNFVNMSDMFVVILEGKKEDKEHVLESI